MVSESWFRSLWKPPRKRDSTQKVVIGVLAFEIASLMSKLVHLWQSLSDKQVGRLREEINNSLGLKKLVSDDDEYIVRLICAEMTESLAHVAKSVARLGKKCSDPSLKNFEHVFDALIQIGADPYGWIYSWKKMEKKVKKMETFISVNANLYQEMEMLADLEQTLRRMKVNDDSDVINLVEFQKKVAWKQQEVKNLREMSLWKRTYDYTILHLARSLFTIFSRIKHVFEIEQSVDTDGSNDSRDMNSDYIARSQSVSSLMQSMVHPSENGLTKFASGPLKRFTTKSGPISKTTKPNNFYSGPLGGSITKSGPISGPGSGTNRNFNSYSGPLTSSAIRSGPISGIDNKTHQKNWLVGGYSSLFNGKKSHQKPNRLTQVGPFKGCMISGPSSMVANCHISSNGYHSQLISGAKDTGMTVDHCDRANPCKQLLSTKRRLLDAPPETLGGAALALHYANVIIVIEKLAASPHLIGLDARDDLYNMLPAKVRANLRAALKPYAKSLASSTYDTGLAGEWNEAITGILEWLAPLAHNMVRWQSERSFEQQNFVSRTNMLLVQTLFFANQEKTEAVITELLVGLNYLWKFGRELNAKALNECASSRIHDEYLDIVG
ncbi:protein PSK SIMULATOR 1 [Benincasa hispida]|uniref:protein PSK SIMULATOR 1 n=1 Tax=Benincasa hispida TaxID=102211 RepID=UPI001901712C|nr:protein PSK SIMULATOR 1 [Benincasa hispida]XP_038885047.1 protein PSK SIMULATOR 1 [Benincasa hispida]